MNILKFLFVSFSILFLCTSQLNSAFLNKSRSISASATNAFDPTRAALNILHTKEVNIGHALRDHAQNTHTQDKSYFYLDTTDPEARDQFIRMLRGAVHTVIKYKTEVDVYGRHKLTMDVHTPEGTGPEGAVGRGLTGWNTAYIRIVFILPNPVDGSPGEILTAFPIDRDQAEHTNFI